MKILISKYMDPYSNFALEETLLKDSKFENENILLIYRNDNSIIIGRNQNTHEEINSDFVSKENIQIARRVSGGGAVYHDKGNINFCFITSNNKKSFRDFLNPIIDFLKSLSLNALFTGKNDVTVDEIKISGNAQYKFKNKIMHHGTLLFDSDLTKLSSALKPNKLKLASKSIKSIRQRVSNIKDLLEEKITTDEFINKLTHFFTENGYELIEGVDLNPGKFNGLVEKNKAYDWNYGKNPVFSFSHSKRFTGGTVTINMNVENNVIKNMNLEGDFLSSNNFESIFNHFIDKPFDISIIENVLNKIDKFSDYFGQLSLEEVSSLFKDLHSSINNPKRDILFIHGFGSNSSYINSLKKLDSNFNFLTLQLPFKGTLYDKPLSIQGYTQYVNDFISKHNLKNFDVVGHSLGGAIAMGIDGAQNRILVSPLNPFAKPDVKWLLPNEESESRESIEGLMHNTKQILGKSISTFIRMHLKFSQDNKQSLEHLVYKEISNHEYLSNELLDRYSKHKFSIIQGTDDKYISMESIKKTIEKFGADLFVIEECGHSPIFEKPKKVLEIINHCLEGV